MQSRTSNYSRSREREKKGKLGIFTAMLFHICSSQIYYFFSFHTREQERLEKSKRSKDLMNDAMDSKRNSSSAKTSRGDRLARFLGDGEDKRKRKKKKKKKKMEEKRRRGHHSDSTSESDDSSHSSDHGSSESSISDSSSEDEKRKRKMSKQSKRKKKEKKKRKQASCQEQPFTSSSYGSKQRSSQEQPFTSSSHGSKQRSTQEQPFASSSYGLASYKYPTSMNAKYDEHSDTDSVLEQSIFHSTNGGRLKNDGDYNISQESANISEDEPAVFAQVCNEDCETTDAEGNDSDMDDK